VDVDVLRAALSSNEKTVDEKVCWFS
jgi:hypothetical protein